MGKQGTQFFQVYACTKRTWLYVNSDIKEELFFLFFVLYTLSLHGRLIDLYYLFIKERQLLFLFKTNA